MTLICVRCVLEKVGEVEGKWDEAWTIIDGNALCINHALDRIRTPHPSAPEGVRLAEPDFEERDGPQPAR